MNKFFFFSLVLRSCKEIGDIGGSKGNGEYFIDPAKNGRHLKVFCDMTTDGGKTTRNNLLIFPDFRHC